MERIVVHGIDIELIKKNIKNVYISVHPPGGNVKVSKLSWIKKQQQKFINQERQPERDYVSGESHYFLGQRYLLNVIYTNERKQGVEIRNKKYIDLYVRENTPKYLRERVIMEWYRNRLKELIPPLISKWEPVMGVKVNEFGVKMMKTRWGTCNPSARRIWVNLELAKKSPICLEYIVVHEMVHLLERTHNERFTAYMDRFIPNWRAVKAELNEIIFE